MLPGAPSDVRADQASPVAAKMEDYQLLDRLGITAGSSLYRARRLADQAPQLFKVLEPEHATPGQLAHFQHEYALLQALTLPGVIRPLALVSGGGRYAMSLEDFPGEPLEALLVRQGRLDLPTCLTISCHLARMLAGLVGAQVVHHDLRPANILVNPQDGRVCLADFSLAATLAHELAATSSLSSAVGDLAYCSPEQTGRMNRPVDYRTDFYSLGVTLYRMLTGQLPFEAHDPLEWVHCHIARQAHAPSAVNPEIPQVVSDLVMKLLAKLPDDRYQSAHGLQFDLDRCLAQWQLCGKIECFPLGEEDLSERFQIPHKLYGREQESASLLAAFEQMAATGTPSLVAVSGYSRVGKSALVDELQKPIVEKRGYFIAGKYDQFMRDIPYATMDWLVSGEGNMWVTWREDMLQSLKPLWKSSTTWAPLRPRGASTVSGSCPASSLTRSSTRHMARTTPPRSKTAFATRSASASAKWTPTPPRKYQRDSASMKWCA